MKIVPDKPVRRAFSRKNVWERTPDSVKTAVGGMLRVLPPAWLLGSQFRIHSRFVSEAQWWSAEQSREYQLTRLRSIIALAYGKTAYYRQAFQNIGFEPGDLKSLDDMGALPTIDKHILRNHLHEMCTVPPDGPAVDSVSTGGSSGIPLRFYIGADRSAVEYAYLVASWERVGYRLDTPLAVMRGQIVPENRQGLRHSYDPILRRHHYSSFHLSDEDLQKYVEHMRGIGPCFLLAYPSTLVSLCRFIEASGISAPSNIKSILAGSETVYPENRRQAECALGVRCFSWYGHTEKLVLATECEGSADYHVWPTYGFFELLDENNRPVTTSGQQGEIVGTGFINTCTPFIRYRTGDYATYVGRKCSGCGRDHLLIREVRGHRTQEVLVAADGSEISWTALNMHDDTFSHVRQFQFSQKDPGRATLRLVPLGGFTGYDRLRILRNLDAKLNGRLHIDIVLCDNLPTTQSGKAIYVDQQTRRVPSHSRCDAHVLRAEPGPSEDQKENQRQRKHNELPDPPCLDGRRIVRPIEVTVMQGARPSPQTVYRHPVRKALTFLGQEGLRWTLAKIRCKRFYRRITRRAALVVVTGKLEPEGDWCVACGQQFSPDLPRMLFRNELVYLLKSRCEARAVSQAICSGLAGDHSAAQRLADFSHYSSEPVPPVPNAPAMTAASRTERAAPLVKSASLSESRRPEAISNERRLIVVGAGDYAYTFVLPNLRKHRFDSVVDYNPLVAKAVGERFGFRYAETDYRRLLDYASTLPALTVVVSSYHSQHTEAAIAFMEANPRACIMIEKPPTVGYRQLAQLLPYMQEEDRFIEVGFNRRYTTMVQRAKVEMVGRAGPRVITCIIREDDMEPSHWYFWGTEGTRVYGNLCHWIDLGVHLIEARPVEIVTLATEDFQLASGVVVRFEDGSLLNLASSAIGSGMRGVQEFIDIRTGDLSIQIYDFRRMVIQRGARELVLRDRTRDKGHRAMYRALAETISQGRRPHYSATDLVRTMTLTEEIRQMLEAGEAHRKVNVDSRFETGLSHLQPEWAHKGAHL